MSLKQTLGIVLVLLMLTACEPTEQTEVNHTDQTANPAEEEGLGLGMTTSGRLGVEVAPGLIVTPKGIGIGIGF